MNNLNAYNDKVSAIAVAILQINDEPTAALQIFSSKPVTIKEKDLQKYAGRYLELTQSFQSAVKGRNYYD
jgi:hypothetical protein